MEVGFNSDISLQGKSFHVQTEDWGFANPYFVSRVFSDGAVIKSIKVPYQDILPNGIRSSTQAIRLALNLQHKKILDLLLSGHLV